MRNLVRPVLATVLLASAVTSCGLAGPKDDVAAGDGFPMTIDNCGRKVVIPHRPTRVVALGPSEVTSVVAAGAASTLVARDDEGKKSAAYTPAISRAVASVPRLGAGGELTREAVVDKQPDLVVGSVTETISPETLAAVGIPMISLRGNCGSAHAPGSSDGTADFGDVMSDVTLFGKLLGTTAQSAAFTRQATQRIATAKATAHGGGRSAAAVIVYENSLEVYGRRSMAHTQFAELGYTDAFGDIDQRVFQANLEQVIRRDPSVIMLLSYGQTYAQARATLLALPGAARLTAVRTGKVFVQPYEFSSQGVLSVDGLSNIARGLNKQTSTMTSGSGGTAG